MPTMRAENDVVSAQVGTYTGRDGFLADVGVTGAVNQAALVGPCQLLLAATDQKHLTKQGQQLLLAQAGEGVYRHESP
jgi:hypothetical protein